MSSEKPWLDEPNHPEFRHAGFPCIIHRVEHHGALCGYVGVPPGHPAHGRGISECDDLEVHGGVTYAEQCAGAICHKAEPGEPDDVWWLGFDTAHFGDLMPKYDELGLRSTGAGTYRDIRYVMGQVEQLAQQLAAMAGAGVTTAAHV